MQNVKHSAVDPLEVRSIADMIIIVNAMTRGLSGEKLNWRM